MAEINEIAEYLKKNDNFLILMHASPDGDTVGGAYGLCRALRSIGKNADCACSDVIPSRYGYMLDGIEPVCRTHEHVLTVDVADPKLLGSLREQYGERIEAAVDHHASNVKYAGLTFVRSDASAVCEIIYDLVRLMGCTVDKKIAECLYTGISTDTGCFRFSNVTPATHRIAAELMDSGIDAAEINRIMFDTKSLARIAIERQVYEEMEILDGGKIAIVAVTDEMQATVSPDEIEGINALTRQIEGVIIGITMRQKDENLYKISVRTQAPINASAICARLGGGGHIRASGCEIALPLDEAKMAILASAREELGQ